MSVFTVTVTAFMSFQKYILGLSTSQLKKDAWTNQVTLEG